MSGGRVKRVILWGSFAAWVAASAAGTTACSTGGAPAGAARTSARPAVAVIPKGTTHEFWKAVHAGALKAGSEAGVEIFWQGPMREDDREEQIKVMDNMRERRVAGIVLAPLDDRALRVPVADAARAGIPVVIFDSDLASEDYVSFVATDNDEGGRLAGEHMAAILKDKGHVILLRYREGSASTTKREEGFLAAIARHPGIEVLSANQYGGATTESAYRASENLLAAFRAAEGQVSGIFCPNESSTFGMLRALQNAKLAGTIRFIGFDSSEKLVQALSDGEIDALVLQNPVNIGYLGVKTLVRHLRGEKVERRIDTGATLVTRENMGQPGQRELLHPDLSVLGGK
jgi:ribose transport system substrate-binding protein